MKQEIKNWIRKNISEYNPYDGRTYTYKLDRAIDDMWFNFTYTHGLVPKYLNEQSNNRSISPGNYMQAINDIEWKYKDYLFKKFTKAWKACYITKSNIF